MNILCNYLQHKGIRSLRREESLDSRAMAACVWGQRETTFYCGNGCGNCAGSGGFGRGRISDDEVSGALVVRGAAKVHLHLQIVKSDSTVVSDCDFWLSWLTLNY